MIRTYRDFVPNTSKISLEYTLRKIDKKGFIDGVVRTPMEEYYSFPHNFVKSTKNGEVIIMALKENCVEISKIVFGKKYKSKMKTLKSKAGSEVPSSETMALNSDTIPSMTALVTMPSRSTVYSKAISITGLTWTYKSINANTPPGAKKPDYLVSASLPSSQIGIPYCWGGFDGVDTSSQPSSWSNFIGAMNKGIFAGNINDAAGWVDGTAGLDCSGFVSAAYGFTTKYSTNTLVNVSTALSSFTAVQSMDMFDKPGTHVMLFDNWSSYGSSAYTLEATTTGNDLTKSYLRTVDYLSTNGYTARTPW